MPSTFVLEVLIRITKYRNERASAASSGSTEVLNMLVFWLCYLINFPYKTVEYHDDWRNNCGITKKLCNVHFNISKYFLNGINFTKLVMQIKSKGIFWFSQYQIKWNQISQIKHWKKKHKTMSLLFILIGDFSFLPPIYLCGLFSVGIS